MVNQNELEKFAEITGNSIIEFYKKQEQNKFFLIFITIILSFLLIVLIIIIPINKKEINLSDFKYFKSKKGKFLNYKYYKREENNRVTFIIFGEKINSF